LALDATESIKLGEKIAIGILKDQKSAYKEDVDGFALTKFVGTTVGREAWPRFRIPDFEFGCR
jgi:hypothetical protein